MARRGRYEFPKHVIDSAFTKWHKENPGRKKEKLEIHHIVAVWFCKKYGIPPDLARSRANAVALTRKEHKERHRNELTEEEYKVLAQAVLGWTRNLL